MPSMHQSSDNQDWIYDEILAANYYSQACINYMEGLVNFEVSAPYCCTKAMQVSSDEGAVMNKTSNTQGERVKRRLRNNSHINPLQHVLCNESIYTRSEELRAFQERINEIL